MIYPLYLPDFAGGVVEMWTNVCTYRKYIKKNISRSDEVSHELLTL